MRHFRQTMVKMRGITKSYAERLILRPTTLDFSKGATTVLLGPSGCGKTTLLRSIVGITKPDEGVIEIDGTPMTIATQEKLRTKMGYVVQEGGLFPHLTNQQNVTLMAHHLRLPLSDIRQRFGQLCALTRFPKEAVDRFPAEISGGQRQRVSLMRALMLDPPLLLLDEPLGALDSVVRSELQKDLKNIFVSLNKTVILVTHDLGEAAFLGDEIVLMREGRVVQKGSLAAFVQKPADAFVSEFIGAYRTSIEPLRQIFS